LITRFLFPALVLFASVLASAQNPSTPTATLRVQAQVLGTGTPIVLPGGGLLGADGWGGLPAVLVKTHRVVNVQSLAVQSPDYFVGEWRKFQQRVGPNPTGAQSPAAPQAGTTPAFDAVLDEVEAAQVQLVSGQPGAFKMLWSNSDDVTLSGGLGGAIAKGWAHVSERLDWVATQYLDGARTHQEVARYVGQDLAYVVLRETIRFKSPADRRPMIQELRVTQVFRREGGRWRIVHRHADSQVTK